jgi:putative transposase
MTVEHDLPIVRACQVAWLSRAAYCKPGNDRMVRDAEVITALQTIVVEEQRWAFWKCHDRRKKATAGTTSASGGCTASCGLTSRRTKRRVPQRQRQPLLVEPRMNARLEYHRPLMLNRAVLVV